MAKRFKKIYIEITNYCNLSCIFCSKDVLPKKEMSLDEFKTIIKRIKEYTESIYLHVKGEPLLHSKLDSILEICKKNNITVCLTTNGTLLKQRKDILLKYNFKQINVSLHCENNYPDYFENVFKVCDELSKKTTIIYRIWTLPSLNLDKKSTTIVDKIQKYYCLRPDVMKKIYEEKNIKLRDNLYLDKDYEFVWPQIGNNQSTTGTCLGTISHIAILSNGTVVPCCLDCNGVIKLGNIFQDELETIIGSELFKKINEGFRQHQIVTDLCKNCSFRRRFDKEK